MIGISIVYPAHNEEASIARVLLEHSNYFSKCYGEKFELIVVIDGSTDGTAHIVADLSKRIPLTVLFCTEPSAKIGAIVAGFRQAKGDLVAFCDTDGFLSPQQLHKLIIPVESSQVDCAISSRFISGSQILNQETDWHRLIDRYRLTNFFSQIFYGLSEKDVECGAKVLNASARDLWLAKTKAEHIFFDAEMLFLLHRAGLKVREIPIEWTFIDKHNPPKWIFTRFISIFNLSIQTIRIACLLLYTRLQHLNGLVPHLDRVEQRVRAAIRFAKQSKRALLQRNDFSSGRITALGGTHLPINVARVLQQVVQIPAIKRPVQVMPDAYVDSWGMPAGVLVDASVVIPTAVRDIGCGYQLLHMPAIKHSAIVELARQIKTLLSYDAPFRREYVQQFSMERILQEGMRYILALHLVSPSELCKTERKGSIENAAIDALESHSMEVAQDYLGMFAEHFLEIREVENIFNADAALKLGIDHGDFILVIHAGSLGLRSEMYRIFYVQMTRYLMKYGKDLGITPQLIKNGLFGVPFESSLGQQFCNTAYALMNYSCVNRFLVRKLLDEALSRVLGTACVLRLLSDISHTSLDRLGNGNVRHRRGVQRVHGYASTELTGYEPLQLGAPTLLGGTRETPSFLFASKLEHTECFCPHGSESPDLQWLRQDVKTDLSGTELRRYVENTVFDTVPIFREKVLENHYINTLFVAQQMENSCGMTRICRVIPKLNLQIHGGGQMPLITQR